MTTPTYTFSSFPFSVPKIDAASAPDLLPRLQKQDFIQAGFKELHDKLLFGNNKILIYFFNGKPLVLAACHLSTAHRINTANLFLAGFSRPNPLHPNDLNLLVAKDTDKDKPDYKIIPLDGETLCGRGLKMADNGFDVENPKDIDFSNQPIETQLFNLGFTELDCQNTDGLLNPLVEGLKLAELFDAARLKSHHEIFAQHSKYADFYKKQTAILEEKLETTRAELKALNNTAIVPKIYAKEVLDDSGKPLVFVATCLNGEVVRVYTSVHRAEERCDHREIKGDIVEVDLPNLSFTLQDKEGKKTPMIFQERDSSQQYYFRCADVKW